jgi:protein-export membrane protein SecD
MHYSLSKIIAICASMLVAALLSLPNILSTDQQTYFRETFGLRPMTLGLDLRGGSNVLLEIDRKDLTEQLQRQLSGDIRTTLRDAKIAYSGIQRIGDGGSVKVTKPEEFEKARTALNTLLQPLDAGVFSTGVPVNLYSLSDANGTFTFAVNQAGLDAKVAAAVKQSIGIIEKRVNFTGTTEPIIQQQGKDRIAVQLPGVQDPEQVKRLLQGTAKLTFNLLCEEQPTGANSNPPPSCRSVPLKEPYDELVKSKGAGAPAPTDAEIRGLQSLWVQTSSSATVDGADLVDAQSAFDQSNQPVVSFRFNNKGALRFGKLTADNVGKPFAIVLDDIVQSYPNINEPILGGSGQISGNFSTQETADLAIVLKSGALPAKLTIVEERTVGPSLGSDSIKSGMFAALIGLIGVMAFMFVPYGFFGLIANFALLGNLLLLLAVMSFFGFTLTLPGIAGIVLTLGMAVDSNVLIYERIREEWRNGRSALSAIETGFKAALGTVLDANVTTLIAGVVLFGVGSGPIRGFAVTLAVGIFTTMFTAFTLTHLMVSLWVKYRRPKEINL